MVLAPGIVGGGHRLHGGELSERASQLNGFGLRQVGRDGRAGMIVKNLEEYHDPSSLWVVRVREMVIGPSGGDVNNYFQREVIFSVAV
jgi:hypothetical protein